MNLLHNTLKVATALSEESGPRLIKAETSSGNVLVCSPFVVAIVRAELKDATCKL